MGGQITIRNLPKVATDAGSRDQISGSRRAVASRGHLADGDTGRCIGNARRFGVQQINTIRDQFAVFRAAWLPSGTKWLNRNWGILRWCSVPKN